MSTPHLKLATFSAGIALAAFGGSADASHFRGAALVPSVGVNGVLTVIATSFWRNSAPCTVATPCDIDDGPGLPLTGNHLNPIQVAGVGPMSPSGTPSYNFADPRFETAISTFSRQLTLGSAPALYNISVSGKDSNGSAFSTRVDGALNIPYSGNPNDPLQEDSVWKMDAAIFWDGRNANAPITFNLANVNPTVAVDKNAPYVSSLGASGVGLTYDLALNDDITMPPPGLTISSTGVLSIPAGSTTSANYPNNANQQGPDPIPPAVGDRLHIGADVAFSGTINAPDGSFVEFEWLFDASTTAAPPTNEGPSITDLLSGGLVGSTILATFAQASDDGLPSGELIWSGLGFSSSTGSCTQSPAFDSAARQFSWTTTNCAPGTYLYNVRVTDTALFDVGLLTINLTQPSDVVPEPATLSLFALGLLGLAGLQRRRRS